MNAADPVRLVPPADRVEGEQTPGMTREQAISIDGLWAGLVQTEAHMTTGWHHHADYDTSIYVIDGSLRMESGPGAPAWSRRVRATLSMYPRVRSTGRGTRATKRVILSWSAPGGARRSSTSMDQPRPEARSRTSRDSDVLRSALHG